MENLNISKLRRTWWFSPMIIISLHNLLALAEVNLGGMESWGFNGVRSGRVSLMSPNKLKIRGLDYTGEGPAVWFMVGKEEEPYNEEFGELRGTIIPDENGSCDRLKRYRNENIILTLPRGMNFTNYDYLAMYCTRFNHNFGYVQLRRDVKFDDTEVDTDERLPKPCPQDHLEDDNEDEDEEEEEEDRKKKRKQAFRRIQRN